MIVNNDRSLINKKTSIAMKKKISLMLLSALLLFSAEGKENTTPSPVSALPLKVGYVDLDYIFGLLPEIKKIESECTSFEKQLQSQLETKIGEFQQKLQAFQQGYETMDDSVRNQKQRELQQLEKNLKQLQLESQEKLIAKRNSLLSPVDEKIRNAVKQIAEEGGYTYIFNANLGGMPVLIYAVEEYNISELVLKKLAINPEKGKTEKEKAGKAKNK